MEGVDLFTKYWSFELDSSSEKCFVFIDNEMKNNYHAVGTVPKSNREIIEWGKNR